MASTPLLKLIRLIVARAVATAALAVLLAGTAGAGPASGPAGAPYSPSDVILNSTVTAKNAGKTFIVSSATVTNLNASTVAATAVRFSDGSVLRSSPTIPLGVFQATNTIPAPFGISGSTFAFSSGTISGRLSVGTLSPDPSAILDASSTTRGFLVPRMTTAQRDAIVSPKTSLLIFNISSAAFQFYSGSGWTEFSQGNLSLGTTNGLSLSGTVLSLGAATAVSTGALKAGDWSTFNGKLSPSGNGSALTGLTKSQVALGNVLNVDQTDADNLASGTAGAARLGSGTPNSAKYLRGDSFWATLDSTAAGLGNVTNNRQVKVSDYAQKGSVLVGIAPGSFASLAPGNDGFTLVTNSSTSYGMEWIEAPYNYSIYNATATAGFPFGFHASTGVFSGVLTASTATFAGTVAISSNVTANNLSGTNTGDVTLLNSNGLSLTGQALFLASATASQTGALTSTDWARFNAVNTIYPATSTASFPLGFSASTGVFSGDISAATGTFSGRVATSSAAVTNLLTASSATFTSLSAGAATLTSAAASGLVSAGSLTASGLTTTSSITVTNLATASSATFVNGSIGALNVGTVSGRTVSVATVAVTSGVTFPDGRTQLLPLAVTVNGTAATTVTSTVAFSSAFTGSGSANVSTIGLNSSSATLQGNTFNGASQLIQATAGAAFPALSGTGITGIPQLASTSTWTAGQTFSSFTVTTGKLGSTTTVAGPLLDKNLSPGTTYDYLQSQSSGTTAAPIWAHSGLVLQSSFTTITRSSASTSGSFVPSGLKVTVTPKFSNSKFEISADGMVNDSAVQSGFCVVSLFENAVNIASGGGTAYMQIIDAGSVTGTLAGPFAITDYVRAPATSSALTYEIYYRNEAGTVTCNMFSLGEGHMHVKEIGQ